LSGGGAIARRTRLLDGFHSVRPAPANLRREDEHLFRHEYERPFGPTDLYELRDVHVTADGVFVHGLRVVPELLYIPGELTQGRLRYAVKARLRPRARFDDPGARYFTAFNRWSPGNYFHWLGDVLPRVYLAREQVEGAVVVLPATHRVPFVESSLGPFRPARTAYFEPGRTAFFREVAVPGHVALTGNYHEPTMRELAGFLWESLGARPTGGRLVYVTRRRAQHRFVLNEDDVITVVRRHGFEVVENEGLSFEGQVALYAGASAYVGIMGANLANVLFMPPRSALLELRRRDDASNHLFFSFAAAKGVDYYYQQCDWVEAGWGIRWNLTVDLDELDANLELMLGRL
jgi:capsular polysaccharide biosynthesis protein